MLFKGTARRSAKDIADEMDAVGGQINAFTSKECTCYYTRTLDTHFDIALDVLSDMFFNSQFNESEINKERNVIVEEINMHEDTPEDLVHDLLQYRIWQNDPLGMTILGTPESIGNLNQEKFKRYFKAMYSAGRTVISVAGNFDEHEVVRKISNAFAPLNAVSGEFFSPAAEVGEVLWTEAKPSAPYAPAFIKKEKDIEQAHICVGFPGITVDSPDTYVMAVLNTLFGGGMSSRLFQKIREEHGLAYSVYSYTAQFLDTGLFAVYSALNPAQIDDVLQLIHSEVKRLFTERVDEDQIVRIKEQLKSNYIMSLESSSNRMNSIGRNLLVLNRVVTADEIIEKVDAVDLDGFYNLAEQVFRLDQMSLSIVGAVPDGTLRESFAAPYV